MKIKRVISVVLCVLLVSSAMVISAEAKKAKKYVKSVSVSKKATLTIPASKSSVSKSFKVTVKVSGKASKKFTAKSADSAVASVKVSGSKINVTAKKAGKAVITVTAKGKSKKGKAVKAKMTVTVKKAAAPAPKPVDPTPVNPDPVDPTPVDPTPADPTQPATAEPTQPATAEPTQPAPAVRDITLTTTLKEISRKGSSGKNEQGEETVVDIPLYQASSVFNYAPANVEELKKVHRADEILPNEVDAAIEAGDKANGRFEVVALYFAALKAFDPKNPDVAYEMMEELCESPTTKILGIDSFNAFSRSAMKDNLSKSYKYKYVGNAYFDGAEPSNGYTPSEPPTVTLEDYVYASQTSNQYQTQVYKIVTRFKGADTERIIQVYQDSIDGKWYIFSDSWKSFTADMKDPALKYQAQWASEG